MLTYGRKKRNLRVKEYTREFLFCSSIPPFPSWNYTKPMTRKQMKKLVKKMRKAKNIMTLRPPICKP